MNGESTGAGLRKATGRAFVYQDAPWEQGSVTSAALFREIRSETESETGRGEATAATTRGLEQGLAALSIPVLYQYAAQPGFELEWAEELAQKLDHELDRELDDGEDEGTDPWRPDSEPARPEAGPETELERQQLLAKECAKAEERGRRAGREQGLAEGRQQGREEALSQLQTSVEAEKSRFLQQTAALFQSFRDARDGYVHRLEQESARLALAIAARILRREAQADPLLLTGAVRVALGQLADSTAVRLRVPAADRAFWEEAIQHLPNLAIRPEVAGDPGLKLGDCRLETELGSANLGLEAQLDVLERGFFSPELADAGASPGADVGAEGGSHGR